MASTELAAFDLVSAWPVERVAVGAIDRSGNTYLHGDRGTFRIASVSKPMTAWATLVAVEDGSVSLDDEVGAEGCTLRHLLSHAGGYGFDMNVNITDKVKGYLRMLDARDSVEARKIRPEHLVLADGGVPMQLFDPREVPVFLRQCREEYGLRPEGLMCIPPADAPPSAHFALLARLARDAGLPVLSMGMSADYEAAIQLGATHVRVGSAIFGARG